jgi:hypothetical protein
VDFEQASPSSAIVYLVERNLKSPAERQLADEPSPSNPSS